MIFTAVVIAASIVAALIDLAERRIPNAITFPLILFGIFFYVFAPSQELLLERWEGGRLFGLYGVLLVGIPFYVLFMLNVVWPGDVKLLMGQAALLGPIAGFRIMIMAVIIAGFFSLFSLVATNRFGNIGLQLRYLFRRVVGRVDVIDRPEPYKIPMGLAIAIAAVLEVFVAHGLAGGMKAATMMAGGLP